MTKKKWVGALFNFFVPGLGIVYSQNIRKGVLTYILFFLAVFSFRFFVYSFGLFLFAMTLILGAYVYLIISGYRSIEKDKVYEPKSLDKWYVYTLIFVLQVAFLESIKGQPLDKISPINFASTPTPSMDPGLRVGDMFAYKKTKSIERYDATVFWFPDDMQTMYIKRCIGLAGDSLRISNAKVFINGAALPDIPLKFRYMVSMDGSKIHPKILEKMHIGQDDYYAFSSDSSLFFLTEQQAKELKEVPSIKKVERYIETEGEVRHKVYPNSETHKWNLDFYGPLYIPKKGDKIQLTDENITLYLKCIEFENESVEWDNIGLTINGQEHETYTFKTNYYFMMGDNRHNSLDSRSWGLLPEELVKGKALYLIWSETRDRIGEEVR
ncbi:MAG TPA: hypothetical protein DIW47_14850 [Bacteroidetes bacterium]|nr:hypothetical protein [Bacteroidota bacterium]